MARVKYVGSSPAEVFPQHFLVRDQMTGSVAEGTRHVCFNRGVWSELGEPVDENLAVFLKLDPSVVQVDATKAETRKACELIPERIAKKRFGIGLKKADKPEEE